LILRRHPPSLKHPRGSLLCMKSFTKLGLTGLTIGLATNLFGLFVFHRHSAIFFSDAWWSAWFPNYMIWSVFAMAGFVIRRRT
jgi:hypothetical protein